MKRPDNLPDFNSPPLNEVVLGVQFSKPAAFNSIQAYEVWDLYKDKFPHVEEQPALAPIFETFGLPSAPQVSFNVVTGAQPNRYWFLSSDKAELIQFQDDRLLHNWRKVGDRSNQYPRFEAMIERFESEMTGLSKYFLSLSRQDLSVNQCEISYINHIYPDPTNGRLGLPDIFRFAQFPDEEPEDFSMNFRRTICDTSGAPIGRLIVEVQTAFHSSSGERIFVFTLTARGAPAKPSLGEAVSFLKLGREMIVNTFADLTSDLAHRIWGRKQ